MSKDSQLSSEDGAPNVLTPSPLLFPPRPSCPVKSTKELHAEVRVGLGNQQGTVQHLSWQYWELSSPGLKGNLVRTEALGGLVALGRSGHGDPCCRPYRSASVSKE